MQRRKDVEAVERAADLGLAAARKRHGETTGRHDLDDRQATAHWSMAHGCADREAGHGHARDGFRAVRVVDLGVLDLGADRAGDVLDDHR